MPVEFWDTQMSVVPNPDEFGLNALTHRKSCNCISKSVVPGKIPNGNICVCRHSHVMCWHVRAV